MERESWVDQVKTIACLGVVIVHLFQSMVKSGLLQGNYPYLLLESIGHNTFVQLFFLCSGYLYQKYSRVNSVQSWKENVIKKAIILGIPYFTFTTITWALKMLSHDYVNEKPEGLFEALFIRPIGQYWFLYILFFIFVITPTIRNTKDACIIAGIAVCMRIISILSGDLIKIHLISNIMEWEFWFVAGMLLSLLHWDVYKGRALGAVCGVLFIILNIKTMNSGVRMLKWGKEVLACASIILLMYRRENNRFFRTLLPYTMPIYLMHTIAAATMRVILSIVGLFGAAIQIPLGLAASIVGPIIAMTVLKAMKLDFIVDPRPILKWRNRVSRK